jgi:putative oxidoreductase
MNALFLVGRLLFGGFFLLNGFIHFFSFAEMTAFAEARAVPFPEVAVAVGGFMLLFGGTSMILGLWPRVGAVVLILFLLPVAVLMHPFWVLPDEFMNFVRNLGLAGAALIALRLPLPWPSSVEERAPAEPRPRRRPAEVS